MKRNAKMKNIEKMCGSYSKEEIIVQQMHERKTSFARQVYICIPHVQDRAKEAYGSSPYL